MALLKSIELPSGVVGNYLRIDSIQYVRGRVRLVLGLYLNAIAAQNNLAPLMSQRLELHSPQYNNTLVDSGGLLATAYQGVKNFANAPEISGVTVDKGLLVGPFEDA